MPYLAVLRCLASRPSTATMTTDEPIQYGSDLPDQATQILAHCKEVVSSYADLEKVRLSEPSISLLLSPCPDMQTD